MTSKKLTVLMLIFLIQNGLFAQNSNNCICLKNDSIKYDVILATRKSFMSPPDNTGYFVTMTLSKKLKAELLRKDFNFWLDKLTNDSSDWAANVLLYYLYDREAGSISVVTEKKEYWARLKPNEIEYWKFFFDKKKKHQ